MCGKDHRYLDCLQKVTNLLIDQTKNTTFQRAFIESVLSFSLVSQFCETLIQLLNGRYLIGQLQLSLPSLYNRQIQQIAKTISKDGSHPLTSKFQLLPSGWRFSVPRCRTKCYKTNLIPAAINELNKAWWHFHIYCFYHYHLMSVWVLDHFLPERLLSIFPLLYVHKYWHSRA